MNNFSGNSGESSNAWPTVKISSVSRSCWCGEKILVKLSKTEGNLYRRYFRCAHASSNRLKDDNHVFKWVDETISNEIESLEAKMCSIYHQLEASRLDNEMMQREMVSSFERVELVVVDAKFWFKKFGVVLVVGFLVGCIGFKVIG